MVKYLDTPISMSAVEFARNADNQGKVALFNLRENMLYAEGDSDDWVELEQKKEAMSNQEDFYVATGPVKKVVINSLGWR